MPLRTLQNVKHNEEANCFLVVVLMVKFPSYADRPHGESSLKQADDIVQPPQAYVVVALTPLRLNLTDEAWLQQLLDLQLEAHPRS